MNPHLHDMAARRGLAECAAKRAIVEACHGVLDGNQHFSAKWLAATACQQLAAVYADHPDCNPGWAA